MKLISVMLSVAFVSLKRKTTLKTNVARKWRTLARDGGSVTATVLYVKGVIMSKVLSPKFFMRRVPHLLRSADRLNDEAESMTLRNEEDARKYMRLKSKAGTQYQEAATINLMLDTLYEYGNDKAKAIIDKEKEKS